MKSYSGNARPYIYALFSEGDRSEAEKVLGALSEKGHNFYFTNRFSRAEHKKLQKAAVLLVFLSSRLAESESLKLTVSEASREDKPIIGIYLEQAVLSPGLSMLLGTTQGVMKQNFKTEEEYLEKICGAPIFADLKVTPAQKTAAKRMSLGLGLASALAVVFAVALVLFNPFRDTSPIDPSSELARLGLSGDALEITELYVYGNTVRKNQAPYVLLNYQNDREHVAKHMYFYETEEYLEAGNLQSLSDFVQLKNLRALSLAGNKILDLAPLGELVYLEELELSNNDLRDAELDALAALPNLKTLNLAYTNIGDLSPLLSFPALETLYIDGSMGTNWLGMTAVDTLKDAPFAIVYVDDLVYDLDALKTALANGKHSIFIGADLEIPAGETLTVPADTKLSAISQTQFINHGTIRIYGDFWSANAPRLTNQGTFVVENGGLAYLHSGKMANYGTLTIAEGGTLVLEDREDLRQLSGSLQNHGYILIWENAILHFEGGAFINEGRIRIHHTAEEPDAKIFSYGIEITGENGEIEETGPKLDGKGYTVDIDTLPMAERLSYLEDPAARTELYIYGNTIRESAVLCQWTMNDIGGNILYTEDTGEKIVCGGLSDLSCITAFENLTHLSLAGNQIKNIAFLENLKELRYLSLAGNEDLNNADLRVLAGLPELEVLDLSFCYISDLSPLKDCPKLKTLYLSYSGEWHTEVTDFGDLEIIFLGAKATDFASFKEASENESVHYIYIRDSFTIPEGETLTLREGVFAASNNQDNQITIDGELIIYGGLQIHEAITVNRGSIRIDDGGFLMMHYNTFTNEGEILIEEGGNLLIHINLAFHQNGGRLVNHGYVRLCDEGTLYYNGGEIINNGMFDFHLGLVGDRGTIVGNGNSVAGTGIFVWDSHIYGDTHVIDEKACLEEFNVILSSLPPAKK